MLDFSAFFKRGSVLQALDILCGEQAKHLTEWCSLVFFKYGKHSYFLWTMLPKSVVTLGEKMNGSSIAGLKMLWSPLVHHFVKKYCVVSGLFPILEQTGNFLGKQAACLSLLYQNILILLKSEPKQGSYNEQASTQCKRKLLDVRNQSLWPMLRTWCTCTWEDWDQSSSYRVTSGEAACLLNSGDPLNVQGL